MLESLGSRLQHAFFTLPDLQGWLITLGLFGLFAVLTVVIVRSSQLFVFAPSRLSLRPAFILALIAFFTPSLPEETLYRALLTPSPPLQGNTDYFWMALSLFIFVAAHPLLAWLLMPSYRQIFYRPAFLLIVALLGVSCTLAYQLTGSIWTAIFIHWLTIVLWKVLFSGPDFGLVKG